MYVDRSWDLLMYVAIHVMWVCKVAELDEAVIGEQERANKLQEKVGAVVQYYCCLFV